MVYYEDNFRRLDIVGDRAFGAVAARIWNSLLPTVTSAATLHSFKKTFENPFISLLLPFTVTINRP